MTERIKKLRIQGFRGATQPLDLSFDTNKSVILIFGENGSGKSTIVDALECVGSGSTSFIKDWKVGSGKFSYIPTLGKGINDVKISLEFGSQSYSATLNAKGVQLCNTPDRPQTKVLRRKSLQAFIDADPAQRYKEVARFLDIPQIEASEVTLRQAYKNAKDTFESATRANVQAQETLHGLWEAEGSPGFAKEFKNAEAWARSQTQSNVESLQQELVDLKSGLKHSDNLTKNEQAYQQASDELKQAKEKLTQAKENLAGTEANENKNNAQLVTLLEDAKNYLQISPDKICPVCEQTEIEADKLVQRLAQRIEGMDALKQANAAVKQAATNQQTKTEFLQKEESHFLNAAQSAQLHFVKELADEDSIKYSSIKNPSIKNQREENKKQAMQLAVALNAELLAQKDALQNSFEKSQKQMHTLTSIKQLIATLDEKAIEARQTETVQKKLGQAVDIFEAKRKAYVETVLLEIATSVDELYQKIHPHEDLGHLKLKLDNRKRGSLVYGVAFKDQQDIHPQPYYSESHLDTLGLCIFLALAKRGMADKTIVILDDVLGSVDQQHLNQTLKMLLEESDSFAQIIFTTHYRPLRNRFVNSRTGSNKVQLIDLKLWTIDAGIRYETPKLAINELEKLLNEDGVPRSQIAIDAGRLLENIFDYISLLYGLRLARKPEPLYALNELYSAVRSIKNWKIISDKVEIEIKPLLDVLGENLPIRNEVGAHYNINGELSTDEEIKEFGLATLKLARSLICIKCSGLPERRDKLTGDWVCQCKATHMQPREK